MSEWICDPPKSSLKRESKANEDIRNVRSKSVPSEPMAKAKRPTSPWIWFYKREMANLKNCNTANGDEIKKLGKEEMMQQTLSKYYSMSDADKKIFNEKSEASRDAYKKLKDTIQPEIRKSPMSTRMSIRAATEVISELTPDQKESVRSIGLGGLLELKHFMFCKKICACLIKNFNCDSMTLYVHGTSINVSSRDVENILGLRDNGIEISKILREQENIEVNLKELKLKTLKLELRRMKSANEEFKKKFALFMLGSFLCPMVTTEVNKNFLYLVSDVDKLSEFNFAKLVLEYLVEGIRERQITGNVYVRGCLAFLMLFYFEYINSKVKEFVHFKSYHTPRLISWEKNAVKKMVKALKSCSWLNDLEIGTSKVTQNHSDSRRFIESKGQNEAVDFTSANHQKVNESFVEPYNICMVIKPLLDDVCKIKAIAFEQQKIVMDVIEEFRLRMDKFEKVMADVKVESHNLKDKLDLRFNELLLELHKLKDNPYNNPNHSILLKEEIVNFKDCMQVPHEGVKEKKFCPSKKMDNIVSLESMSEASNFVHKTIKEKRVERDMKKENQAPVAISSSSVMLGSMNHLDKARSHEIIKPSHCKRSLWFAEACINTMSAKKSANQPNNETKEKLEKAKTDGVDSKKRKVKIVCKWSKDPEIRKVLEFMFLNNSNTDNIVHISFVTANHYVMRSLYKESWVSQEVINLVAVVLKRESTTSYLNIKPRVWYMPTYYSQLLLKTSGILPKELDDHRHHFLDETNWGGEMSHCDKIFIPMHGDRCHWYACVIDFIEQKVIILDSLWPTRGEYKGSRLSDVKQVIEISHKIFKLVDGYMSNVDFWPIEAPKWIPQQTNGYDCGIYVIKFMKMIDRLAPGIRIQFDSEIERQKLAIDLFYDKDNQCRQDILQKIKDTCDESFLGIK